jgi:hypothetical protein
VTHSFMYPRVTQIATRAHSVPASWLGSRLVPGTRDRPSGPTVSGAANFPTATARKPSGLSG